MKLRELYEKKDDRLQRRDELLEEVTEVKEEISGLKDTINDADHKEFFKELLDRVEVLHYAHNIPARKPDKNHRIAFNLSGRVGDHFPWLPEGFKSLQTESLWPEKIELTIRSQNVSAPDTLIIEFDGSLNGENTVIEIMDFLMLHGIEVDLEDEETRNAIFVSKSISKEMLDKTL